MIEVGEVGHTQAYNKHANALVVEGFGILDS